MSSNRGFMCTLHAYMFIVYEWTSWSCKAERTVLTSQNNNKRLKHYCLLHLLLYLHL